MIMIRSFKYIVSILFFLLNFNIFPKNTCCCCCKDKDEMPEDIKKWFKEIKKQDEERIKKLNEEREKNPYIYNYSLGDKTFPKEYNEKYDNIFKKYLETKGLDKTNKETTYEGIKSQNHVRKITIDNNKVIFIKHDKHDNSFYIDLLKSLDYCDLEYLYQDGVILTEEVKNDYEIELKDNFNREYFNKTKDILEKTENLLPYFTILSFLNFWDCGTLKLNNHIFKKQSNGKYLIKVLDIDVKEYREGNDEDYYNFYFDLNTGFNMFNEIRLFVTQTFNSNDLDFKKFIIFTNYSINYIPVISKIFKDEVEELQEEEKSCFEYFGDNISSKIELNDYLEKQLKYDGNYRDKDIFEFLIKQYKGDFNKFLKDYIMCSLKDEDDCFNDNKTLIKVCKYLKIEEKEDYTNDEKVEIVLKLYQKLIEKTEKTFELLFEYFKFYNYLGDKMKEITEEQKGEIKRKFDKMLDFLIINKDNNKYDKDQIDNVVNNIKKIQKSTLFRFIFDDENINGKISKLT